MSFDNKIFKIFAKTKMDKSLLSKSSNQSIIYNLIKNYLYFYTFSINRMSFLKG